MVWGSSGRVAEVLVRSRPQQSATGGAACDIRIAVAGNVDSGKSTLIGVFTGTGKLDNGNGGARSQVFTHQVPRPHFLHKRSKFF